MVVRGTTRTSGVHVVAVDNIERMLGETHAGDNYN
jgi:hypothetical protein